MHEIKEIESSFKLKPKQDVKRSDLRLDTRFKLKRARLQEIQSNATKARAKTTSSRSHNFLFINFLIINFFNLRKFSISCQLR